MRILFGRACGAGLNGEILWPMYDLNPNIYVDLFVGLLCHCCNYIPSGVRFCSLSTEAQLVRFLQATI